MASYTVLDTQQTSSARDRQREGSFNYAEAVLNTQAFILSRQWAGQRDGQLPGLPAGHDVGLLSPGSPAEREREGRGLQLGAELEELGARRRVRQPLRRHRRRAPRTGTPTTTTASGSAPRPRCAAARARSSSWSRSSSSPSCCPSARSSPGHFDVTNPTASSLHRHQPGRDERPSGDRALQPELQRLRRLRPQQGPDRPRRRGSRARVRGQAGARARGPRAPARARDRRRHLLHRLPQRGAAHRQGRVGRELHHRLHEQLGVQLRCRPRDADLELRHPDLKGNSTSTESSTTPTRPTRSRTWWSCSAAAIDHPSAASTSTATAASTSGRTRSTSTT